MATPIPGPSTATASPIPRIHLICMDTRCSTAFTEALPSSRLPQSITSAITVHNTHLGDLPQGLTFDCVVSPANSYSLLDGGYDDAISRYFSPHDNYIGLTRAVQRHMYTTHRGFLSPGQCELVAIPEDLTRRSRNAALGWGCGYIAMCPTMRVPEVARWNREVVYECVWNLLCAVERHNLAVEKGGMGKKIESLLMSPLATGIGKVSPAKWASQLIVALKHWEQSGREKEVWESMGWEAAERFAMEVEKTHEL